MKRNPGAYMFNDFWALGPNVTGWQGGYPNGFLQRCKAEGIWGPRRLHVCSGSIEDGITVDISRAPKGGGGARPLLQADAAALPLRDASFDVVLADPPYSEERADGLYGLSLVSVPALLKEASRVTRPGGKVGVLDWRVWPPPTGLKWWALIAVYTANRGPKPLRAFAVYRRSEAPLEAYSDPEPVSDK